MKYDLVFTTPKENVHLIEAVGEAVGRPADSGSLSESKFSAAWRFDTQVEAEQMEARIRALTAHTLGVQPVPDVSSGSVLTGGQIG